MSSFVRQGWRRRIAIVAGLAGALGTTATTTVAQRIPERLSDREFWQLITDVSEPGGYFRSDNFLSNEAGFQYVIPELLRTTGTGGIYLGVGPEQNFTYIVAMKPAMAIIFDIRRGNMHAQLLYKALFEMSADRAEFVSKLFSRPRPAGLDSTTSPDSLFAAYIAAAADTAMYVRNAVAVKKHLTSTHGWALSDDDLKGIDYVYDAFFFGGPTIDYNFNTPTGGGGGFGGGRGGGRRPTYADLMVQDDGQGLKRSYLATEANFRVMKDLETRNMLVPVVGNFAGPRAIRAVGEYLKARKATVSAFYASNVEQYLFQDADSWRKYYENVETLPLDSTSTFIRSVGGGRFVAPATTPTPTTPIAPFGRLQSVLSSMQGTVAAYREGRIMGYWDVIQMSR